MINAAWINANFRVERWGTQQGEIANIACGVGQHRVRRFVPSRAASRNTSFFDTFFVKDFPMLLRGEII